jgi:multidrug efflux pump subunit AcrB
MDREVPELTSKLWLALVLVQVLALVLVLVLVLCGACSTKTIEIDSLPTRTK